ncbi:MAG: formylglycine-generating enzyme family protein [Oculatellaceae cyanobacterium Prado106]|jgi:formylglycine-generating enzyme required for sulfatase activity|nr:formylglycine-generating enzyme family protein [Oculatellaceae cyanobacterium Prado106]
MPQERSRHLSPLAQFIARLRQAEIDWDGENIADLLWLARYGVAPHDVLPVESSTVHEPLDESSSPVIRTETLDSPIAPLPPPPDLGLYAQGAAPRSTSKPRSPSGIPLQTPTAPPLRKTLSIGRSLRPFMRKVDSYTRTVLDEEETAEQTAERKFCMTVVKPDQERWLEVALVIEETPISFIWQETIQEFKQLLEHQGAFRSVNRWYLRREGDDIKLFSQPSGSRRQTPRNLKELVDASGRRLILVLSDCVSLTWQQGLIQKQCLALWGKHCPIAILQLLPSRLWGRTKLTAGVMVKLGGLTPGTPNRALELHEVPLWAEGKGKGGLKLPLVTMEPESLDQWAKMVAGFGEYRAAGVWFDEQGQDEPDADEPTTNEPQASEDRERRQPIALPSEQLVHRFNATASLPARRLASLMAFVPIQLPIVYLIQKTMLPDSTTLHLAEIFMSGLVQREDAAGSSLGKSYRFVPGVQERLVDLADRNEAEQMLDHMSEYIGQKMGRSLYSFTALLMLAKQLEGTEGTEDLAQFARVSTPAIARLGGHYATFVESLEEMESLPTRVKFPPLQTLEFVTVYLVDEEESNRPPLPVDERHSLQPFEYTVATLQFRQQNWLQRLGGRGRGEWVIQRQQRQGLRLVESLTEGLDLELVPIPGGRFQMGSPKDEPERRDTEDPQHEVEVQEFLMGRYPVTQAQWRFVAELPQVVRTLEADPSKFKGGDRPIEQVSWLDAQEFCARLSQHTGRSYRLPTEAEWEYACRAGTTTPFHFGEMITPDLANYDWDVDYNESKITRKKDFEGTTPVDRFGIANAFGLCDMHGNVWEWCEDQWHSDYQNFPHEDGKAWIDADVAPQDENVGRVIRGGSWNLNPRYCRSATRYGYVAGVRNDIIGFRVVGFASRTR